MSPFEGQLQSPFVDSVSFETEQEGYTGRASGSAPFVEALFGQDGTADSHGAARRLLLAELYDEEMDEAVYELMGEVSALAGADSSRLGAAGLRLQLSPFLNEVDAVVDRVAGALGPRPIGSLTESEIDGVVSGIAPERQLSPAFDNFLGKIAGAIGKTLKKGVQLAGNLALGPLLGPLRKIVGKFVRGVIDTAISRLPKNLQPLAQTLRTKLGAGEIGEENAIAPSIDVSSLQSEFNEQIADLLLGESGTEYEEEHSGWTGAHEASQPGIADLDAARERFVSDLAQLGEGEDPGPAIERFLPALLPILKMGIRLIGKERFKGTFVKLVSSLIGRFIGQQPAKSLSTALVDAGMKLMGFEVTDADVRNTASAAIATTVEETVREVAALPASVLENESLLEGSIVRAFERSAAANLPRIFPEAVYRRRPDLAETDAIRGAWIPFPVRGPKRCKKFSRVMRTRITPRMAMAVPIFGSVPLSYYLQEQLGVEPGEELEADVHLYESMPGTVLGEVARLESNGNGAIAASAEFHPLNAEAAAILLREPGLGRNLPARSAPQLAVGQRFYRIVVPGRRVNVIPASGTKHRPRRRTAVSVVIDFPGDRIVVKVFLAERRAQELAASLRKQGHAGAVASTLSGLIERGVAGALNGNVTGSVRILHEALELEEARGTALRRVPAGAVRQLASRVGEWTLTAVAEFLGKQTARFISATEDAQDGVTVVVTLANPPGMAAMRNAVAGKAPAADAGAQGRPSGVTVDVVPGFAHA